MRASSQANENGSEQEKFMVTTPLYYANAGEEWEVIESCSDECDG